MNNLNNQNISTSLNEEEQVDLTKFIQTLYRNKFLIILISLITTIGAIIDTYTKKEIWMGNFNIVVREENSNLGTVSSLSTNSIISTTLGVGSLSGNETQRITLSSPSVLKPVYEYVKEYNKNNGQDTSKMNYTSWIKSALEIEFEKNSSVLSVNYKNSDKEHIINVLKLIASSYEDYSKSFKEKNINKTIDYLKSQKSIMEKKYKNSQLELNKFSVKNGLGTLDGFIAIGKPTNSLTNNPAIDNLIRQNSSPFNINLNTNFQDVDKSAGQRYKIQFNQLEKYESQFVELSSKLKPNSRTLTNLKLKIENLKSSLKRPNEILLKYKELTKNVNREDQLLKQVENNLEIMKLEKLKNPDPWVIISEPIILPNRVYPSRTKTALLAIIISTIFSSLLAIFKEYRSGILFSEKDIMDIMITKSLCSIFTKNPEFSKLAINEILLENTNENIALLNSNYNSENIIVNEIIKSNNYNVKVINEISDENINNYSKILVFVENEKIKKETLKDIKRYMNLFEKKFIGWIYQS